MDSNDELTASMCLRHAEIICLIETGVVPLVGLEEVIDWHQLQGNPKATLRVGHKAQGAFGRSVEVVRLNIHLADLQWANDIRLYRDHIFLVLKLALD
jgi:hypothetical protein